MKNEVDNFKEVMKNGMLLNFKDDGFLTPVLFFLVHNMHPQLKMIPNEFLSTKEGKQLLADKIKNICSEPDVIAAGIIIEASGIKIDLNSPKDLFNKINSGEVKVSDLKEREDYILMIFSTPEKDEKFSYVVDVENKKIIEEMGSDNMGLIAGTFSNFFQWNKQ